MTGRRIQWTVGIVFAAFLALIPGVTEAEGASRFNTFRIAPKGSVPPKDFVLPDLLGKKRRLSDYRGKVVLLSYFATWCPLCNVEMPKLTHLHKKLKERGFSVLAVSIDRAGVDLVRRWAKGKGLTYPILHDQRFTSRQTHNVRFVPTFYLLDRDLRLAAWGIGAVDWEGKEATTFFERLLDAKPTLSSVSSNLETVRFP